MAQAALRAPPEVAFAMHIFKKQPSWVEAAAGNKELNKDGRRKLNIDNIFSLSDPDKLLQDRCEDKTEPEPDYRLEMGR